MPVVGVVTFSCLATVLRVYQAGVWTGRVAGGAERAWRPRPERRDCGQGQRAPRGGVCGVGTQEGAAGPGPQRDGAVVAGVPLGPRRPEESALDPYSPHVLVFAPHSQEFIFVREMRKRMCVFPERQTPAPASDALGPRPVPRWWLSPAEGGSSGGLLFHTFPFFAFE